MNYKSAYKVLNQSGEIDNIINDETKNGENLLEVKKNIVDGINYYIEFKRESSFRAMKYWWNSPEKSHQRITQRICKQLAQKELETMERQKEYLEYMIKSL